MNTRYRVSSLLTATALALAGTLASTSAAEAATGCATPGAYKAETTNVKSSWTTPEAAVSIEENYSGSKAAITFSTTKDVSLSNSVKVTAAVKAQWQVFEATAGVELGASGTVRKLTQVTKTYTLASGDTYVFGKGSRTYTATSTVYKCQKINMSGIYAWVKVDSGTIKGYKAPTSSVVACKSSPASGTLAARLKSLYC